MLPVQQHRLEHIYLSEEGLNSLELMTNDVFEYLKFQAERGDIESQVGSRLCQFHSAAVRAGK